MGIQARGGLGGGGSGKRSRQASFCGVFTSRTATRIGTNADAVGVPGNPPMHKTASGHDFAQPGTVGFPSGQQGMPSGMDVISIDAISDIADADAPSNAAARNGITVGAVRRPTTARIESRRGMSDQSFTMIFSHRMRREKR
jgi:hypothetical protein